jgi:hypothetical protein
VYPFSSRASGQSSKSGYLAAARAEIVNSLANGPHEWQTITFRKAS